jgi:MULE transposase domain
MKDMNRGELDGLLKAGVPPKTIISSMQQRTGKRRLEITPKDLYNLAAKLLREQLGTRTPIQALVTDLEAAGMRPKYKTTSNGRVTHLFFIHPETLQLWKRHPDVMLMDCTYKTNKFRMPLLNIVFPTGLHTTIQLGLCFMSSEKEEDYKWALACLKAALTECGAPDPPIVVTDREKALMNALSEVFPNTTYLLCVWHVLKNVTKHCRRDFPRDEVPGALQAFQAFIRDWTELLHAPTEAVYYTRLEAFRANHPKTCTDYCESTWLTPYKELLVSAWIDQYAHFGHTETSRVEGAHACLKASIRVSTMDLYATFKRINAFWETQIELYDQAMEASKTKCPVRAQAPIFTQLLTRVYPWALNKIIQQYMLHRKYRTQPPPNPTPCSGKFMKTWGLPCWHKIRQCEQNGEVLQLAEIHVHWLYEREDTIRKYRNQLEDLLEPSVIRGKGRPKEGTPDTSTRREKSHWEVTEPGYSLQVKGAQAARRPKNFMTKELSRLSLGGHLGNDGRDRPWEL